MSLLDGLFSTKAMSAVLDDCATLQAMLDVEAALALALAECGIVPQDAAAAITRCCRADAIDAEGLAEAATRAGNLAIPLVKQLTALVARYDRESGRWVHWGATSQDVIDTGTVLQLRSATALIDADLVRLERALADLARLHAHTVMPGRTWLQQALPVSLGLKAAGWLAAVHTARRDLSEVAARACILQFGGAAGTLASLGVRGLDVAAALARHLELALPPAPWHADRTAFAAVSAALGIVCGALGKMARDIALLMQTEIGEACEPAGPGKGGSSTMPHKRNPVGCAIALSVAMQAPQLVATMLAAMVQEHERGLGGWHAEWQTLPTLLRLTASSAAQMAGVAAGVEISPERMAQSLDRTQGLLMTESVSMALAEYVGKADAHRLVEQASHRAIRDSIPLRAALAEQPEVVSHLTVERIDGLLDPATYLGMTDAFIARILVDHDERPTTE